MRTCARGTPNNDILLPTRTCPTVGEFSPRKLTVSHACGPSGVTDDSNDRQQKELLTNDPANCSACIRAWLAVTRTPSMMSASSRLIAESVSIVMPPPPPPLPSNVMPHGLYQNGGSVVTGESVDCCWSAGGDRCGLTGADMAQGTTNISPMTNEPAAKTRGNNALRNRTNKKTNDISISDEKKIIIKNAFVSRIIIV